MRDCLYDLFFGTSCHTIRASQAVLMVKKPPANEETQICGFKPSQEDPLEKETVNPLQYFCLENHRQRSLLGYRPWGHN